MSRKDIKYVVHTEDTTYYFERGRTYKSSYLKQVFKKKIKHIELFPGLIVEDESGNLLTTELRVVLIPVKEPEKKP